jgi:hypothetical protein
MRIDILQPIPMVVDHAVTFCEPENSVGWIDNGAGVTIEQWVTFNELSSGMTRVSLTGEIAGREHIVIEGKKIEIIVQEFTKTWFENFRLVCDELALDRY